MFVDPKRKSSSPMSDSSDQASSLSSISLSSMFQKYQSQNSLDMSIDTSIWETDDSLSTSNICEGNGCSSSSSSASIQKYREVERISSSLSSRKNIHSEPDEGNFPSPRKKCISSSEKKRKISAGAGFLLSETDEENDSISPSVVFSKREQGDIWSVMKMDSGTNFSSSEISLKYTKKCRRELVEKTLNIDASFPPNHDQAISNLSLSTNGKSKRVGVNMSSSDAKDEVFTNSTLLSPPGVAEKSDIKVEIAGSYVSSSSRTSPANSIGSTKIEKEYDKETLLTQIARKVILCDKYEQKSNEFQGFALTNASTANFLEYPVSVTPVPTSFSGEKTPDYLTSVTDTIIYKDYSTTQGQNPYALCKKNPRFPQKLHQILSHPDSKKWIVWLPHGRAWKILDQSQFQDKVLPKFFPHGKMMSFMRQVSHWGFKRVHNGPDKNSYYHELFLRGLPHVSEKMKRKPTGKSKDESRSVLSTLHIAPDFYQISKEHPLPDEN